MHMNILLGVTMFETQVFLSPYSEPCNPSSGAPFLCMVAQELVHLASSFFAGKM